MQSTVQYLISLTIVNCVILKTASYIVIFCLMQSYNSWRTCAISKLCFTLIYNVLLAAMLCGCDLHIATPYSVQSVLNIANHNRLENSSEPRNRESIKRYCTIILQLSELSIICHLCHSMRNNHLHLHDAFGF